MFVYYVLIRLKVSNKIMYFVDIFLIVVSVFKKDGATDYGKVETTVASLPLLGFFLFLKMVAQLYW